MVASIAVITSVPLIAVAVIALPAAVPVTAVAVMRLIELRMLLEEAPARAMEARFELMAFLPEHRPEIAELRLRPADAIRGRARLCLFVDASADRVRGERLLQQR